MTKISKLFLLSVLSACASQNQTSQTANQEVKANAIERTPAATNLSGSYLGEGIFDSRRGPLNGIARPAVRLYLEKVEGENAYWAVIHEYDNLWGMAAPYLSAQKAPALNKVIGYLDKISKRIEAFKVFPVAGSSTFNFHKIRVKNSQIAVDSQSTVSLVLGNPARGEHALTGARISGSSDGDIEFPGENDRKGFFGSLFDMASVSQLELAKLTYAKAKLKSTWRGELEDLLGSYLSEYAKLEDGVLEFSAQGNQFKAQFFKSSTLPQHYTSPKSAGLEGEFFITEPERDIFVLVPAKNPNSATSKEMVGRLGLFLDIFDASAPEAGGHLVTEVVFINPDDPADVMMYYQHPEHKKNVGPRK